MGFTLQGADLRSARVFWDSAFSEISNRKLDPSVSSFRRSSSSRAPSICSLSHLARLECSRGTIPHSRISTLFNPCNVQSVRVFTPKARVRSYSREDSIKGLRPPCISGGSGFNFCYHHLLIHYVCAVARLLLRFFFTLVKTPDTLKPLTPLRQPVSLERLLNGLYTREERFQRCSRRRRLRLSPASFLSPNKPTERLSTART